MSGKNKHEPKAKKSITVASSGAAQKLIQQHQHAPSLVAGLTGLSGLTGLQCGNTPADGDQIFPSSNYPHMIHLKALFKKNPTTKLKALSELDTLVFQDKATADATLSSWFQAYQRLVSDDSRKVRESANTVLVFWLRQDIVQKLLPKYIKNCLGPWLCSIHDTCKEVSAQAILAFEAIPDANRPKAIYYAKSEIFIYLKENLKQTVGTLSSVAEVAKDVAEERYVRLISATVGALITVLSELQKVFESSDYEADFLSIFTSQFWRFTVHKNVLIRRSTYRLLKVVCLNSPSVVDQKTLAPMLLGAFIDKQPSSEMWDCLLTWMKCFPESWSLLNIRKVVLPRLWTFLRSGTYSTPSLSYPSLLPYLNLLPLDIVGIGDPDIFLKSFFSSFWFYFESSVAQQRSPSSNQELFFLVKAYCECALYTFNLASQNQSDCLKNFLVTSILPNSLQSLLLLPQGDSLCSSLKFFAQTMVKIFVDPVIDKLWDIIFAFCDEIFSMRKLSTPYLCFGLSLLLKYIRELSPTLHASTEKFVSNIFALTVSCSQNSKAESAQLSSLDLLQEIVQNINISVGQPQVFELTLLPWFRRTAQDKASSLLLLKSHTQLLRFYILSQSCDQRPDLCNSILSVFLSSAPDPLRILEVIRELLESSNLEAVLQSSPVLTSLICETWNSLPITQEYDNYVVLVQRTAHLLDTTRFSSFCCNIAEKLSKSANASEVKAAILISGEILPILCSLSEFPVEMISSLSNGLFEQYLRREYPCASIVWNKIVPVIGSFLQILGLLDIVLSSPVSSVDHLVTCIGTLKPYCFPSSTDIERAVNHVCTNIQWNSIRTVVSKSCTVNYLLNAPHSIYFSSQLENVETYCAFVSICVSIAQLFGVPACLNNGREWLVAEFYIFEELTRMTNQSTFPFFYEVLLPLFSSPEQNNRLSSVLSSSATLSHEYGGMYAICLYNLCLSASKELVNSLCLSELLARDLTAIQYSDSELNTFQALVPFTLEDSLQDNQGILHNFRSTLFHDLSVTTQSKSCTVLSRTLDGIITLASVQQLTTDEISTLDQFTLSLSIHTFNETRLRTSFLRLMKLRCKYPIDSSVFAVLSDVCAFCFDTQLADDDPHIYLHSIDVVSAIIHCHKEKDIHYYEEPDKNWEALCSAVITRLVHNVDRSLSYEDESLCTLVTKMYSICPNSLTLAVSHFVEPLVLALWSPRLSLCRCSYGLLAHHFSRLELPTVPKTFPEVPNNEQSTVCTDVQLEDEAYDEQVLPIPPSLSAVLRSEKIEEEDDNRSGDLGFCFAWAVFLLLLRRCITEKSQEARTAIYSWLRLPGVLCRALRILLRQMDFDIAPPKTSPLLLPSNELPSASTGSVNPLQEAEVERVFLPKAASFLFSQTVRLCCAQVRLWWKDERDRNVRQFVERYVEQYISQDLISSELELVSTSALENAQIRVSRVVRQITCYYEKDEVTLEVQLKFPSIYPLQSVELEAGRHSGVPESQWRKWQVSMRALLMTQDGTVSDVCNLWYSNLDRHFEGIEVCPICYSLFAPNGALPACMCRTCKNSFHNVCLYKWFSTSHKSNCPLCNSDFAIARHF